MSGGVFPESESTLIGLPIGIHQDWPLSGGLPVEGYDFLASGVFEQ